MITLEHVTKRYPGTGVVAVDDLSLHIPEGLTVALIGPSGCGKTTTMRMVNRLVDPTAGRILVNGEDVTHGDPVMLRRHIGYVIQQVGLFPHMTIAQNVAAVPNLLGWDQARTMRRTEELLQLVGLDPEEMLQRYPAQLSGGQRQRVGVARALAADPGILLMDEPFGALDPLTRDELQREFLSLQHRLKKTVVFVTHDLREALRLGTRIALMEAGKLVTLLTPDEFVKSADPWASAYVRAFGDVAPTTANRVRS